jgi:hypothetical protein
MKAMVNHEFSHFHSLFGCSLLPAHGDGYNLHLFSQLLSIAHTKIRRDRILCPTRRAFPLPYQPRRNSDGADLFLTFDQEIGCDKTGHIHQALPMDSKRTEDKEVRVY